MMGNTYCGPSLNVTISGVPHITVPYVSSEFDDFNGSYTAVYGDRFPFLGNNGCGKFYSEDGTIRVHIENGVWIVTASSTVAGETYEYNIGMHFEINPDEFNPCDPSGTAIFVLRSDNWFVPWWVDPSFIPTGLTGTCVVSK